VIRLFRKCIRENKAKHQQIRFKRSYRQFSVCTKYYTKPSKSLVWATTSYWKFLRKLKAQS